MPPTQLADDKIETLVGLVLQAVDQRLTTVREQLIDLTNTVAHNHAELQEQIADCHQRIASNAGATGGSAETDGPPHDAAAAQLLQAANMLTERVTYLESRANQYTNERVAELRELIEQLPAGVGGPAAVLKSATPVTASEHSSAKTPPVPPSVMSLGSLGSISGRPTAKSAGGPSAAAALTPIKRPAAPTVAATAAPAADPTAAGAAGAAAKVAQPSAATSASGAPAAAFDIDAFSAQLNKKLAALVERVADA